MAWDFEEEKPGLNLHPQKKNPVKDFSEIDRTKTCEVIRRTLSGSYEVIEDERAGQANAG